MVGKMNCAIYHGVGEVTKEEREIPQGTSKDVLVKILRAGICGSDTGAYAHGGEPYGIFKRYQFGHEMVGKVVEVGSDIMDIEVDDVVFINPIHASKLGEFHGDMTGGFSEYVLVDNVKVDFNIYKLSKDVDLDAAVLVEPISVGTRGALCTNPSIDSNVVVLGAGTIGLGAVAGLMNKGIKNVVVVDRVGWRLDIARKLGAKTIDTSNENLFEKLIEYFGVAKNGAGIDFSILEDDLKGQIIEYLQNSNLSLGGQTPNVDLFIDAAGAAQLLQEVFTKGKANAKYVVVAVYSQEIPMKVSLFMSNEAIVTGSKGYTHETIAEVIELVEKKEIPIKTMITKKFAHKDFPQAIKEACDVSSNIKVVIDYEI